MMIQYSFQHIRRDWRHGIAIVSVTLSLVALIVSLSYVRLQQSAQIDSTMDNMPVKAVVSDVYGYRLDDLHILPAYIDVFSDPKSNIGQYIEGLCLKRAIHCRVIDAQGAPLPVPDTTRLVGLTRLEADPMLSQNNGATIRFHDGYDAAALQSGQSVCLVSQEIANALGDAKTILLDFDEAVQARRRLIAVETADGGTMPGGEAVGIVELTVIGTIQDGISDAIYCPWGIIRPIDERIYGYALADSMSFIVRDNWKLNELKIILRGYFVQVTPGYNVKASYAKPDTPPHALTLYDEDLLRIITSLERSAAFLQAIIPVILGLSVGIGFLSSYLSVRNRKPELALMRSLGTAKHWAFLLVFTEQLALCALGFILGLGLMTILQCLTPAGAVFALLFIACFLLGAGISVWGIVRVNVTAIMNEKE